MKQTYKLKDNIALIIRNPKENDVKKSHEFFMSFPETKRRFFRSDVTKVEHIKKRIKDAKEKN